MDAMCEQVCGKEVRGGPSQPLPVDCTEVELPHRLHDGAQLQAEYAWRMEQAEQSGGYVSKATSRRLTCLLIAAIDALDEAGQDGAAVYMKLKHVVVRVCISDADLPFDDDGGYMVDSGMDDQ